MLSAYVEIVFDNSDNRLPVRHMLTIRALSVSAGLHLVGLCSTILLVLPRMALAAKAL